MKLFLFQVPYSSKNAGVLFSKCLFLFLLCGFDTIAQTTVALTNYQFQPNNFTVNAGEKIVFNFNVSETHNIVSVSVPPGVDAFSSGEPGSVIQWEYIPQIPGVYSIKCEPHSPGMDAVFTVLGTSPTITTAEVFPVSVCEKMELSIPFTTTGVFTSDFHVLLSDKSGSFSFPTTFTEIKNSGNMITITIPSSLEAGNEYRVKVVSGNIKSAPNTQNIRISKLPVLFISSNKGNLICNGALVTFTAINATHPEDNDFRFEWFLNHSLAGSDMNNTFSYSSLKNNDLVYVTATSSENICISPNTVVTSPGITITVSSSVVPTVEINAIRNNCYNPVHTITAVSLGEGETPAYTWKVNHQLLPFSANSFTITDPYIINVTLTSGLACASPKTAFDSIILPVVDFFPLNMVQDSACLAENPSTCFKQFRLGGTLAGANFRWFVDDRLIPGQNSPVIIPTISGIYHAIQQTQYCGDATSPGINFKGVISNVNVFESNSLFSVYPIPTQDKITVVMKGDLIKAKLKIDIYDNRGVRILSSAFDESYCSGGKAKACKCPGIKELNIVHLSPGNYYLCISGNKQLHAFRFIKE